MPKLKYDPKNARKHNDRNKDMIRRSLEKCGAGRSIVLDDDGYIIAGNGVFKQADELGIPIVVVETDGTKLVAVKRTDLKPGDPRRTRLALFDNRTAELAEWDWDVLEEMDAAELDGMEFEFPDMTIPDENKTIDEELMKATENECPSCGFRW